ncbi:hypothetical protein GCM10017600_70770 [Streptosporangium carneum]|uniref:Uncharacterized protein n=1 Tax=Streptosporangium carneum TaxID=47481 RepID=A0A9W6I7T5_9ACTN|nr:hypothetical protein GCM10017600_70770 [Streptosporangium carneum]
MGEITFGEVTDRQQALGEALALRGGNGHSTDAAVRIAQPPRQFVF